MLLVTTADETTWGRDEDILFLGSWCLIASREAALEGRRYRVLPYHWDDRGKFYRDAELLRERCEQILPRLASQLNAIHGTRHDMRYWRLAAGSWLIWMLAIVWDRLECLKRAAEIGADLTYVYENATLPALDFNALGGQAPRSDLWNHTLCARILAGFPTIACRSLPEGVNAVPQGRHHNQLLTITKMLLRGVARVIRPSVVLVNLHAAISVQLRLQRALRQLPLVLSAPAVPIFERDAALRENLIVDCGSDDFGTAMSAILAESFPAALLEGYEVARALALQSFPSSPRVIVTANAHANELFCLWAGEQKAQLMIVQHGGHYGVDRVEMMEDHELAVADVYCSWGWRREGYGNIVPMPSFKIETVCSTPTSAARHGMLAIYDSAHRYPYRVYNVPIAGQRRVDNALQLELLRSLPPSLREQLRLRTHPLDDGFGFRQTLEREGLADRFDTSRDMITAIKSARLCLVASNSTPFLEAMVSGTPTLACYDPVFAEERAEAKPFFDALRAAGILYGDPAACAAKIVEVWDNPQDWWGSTEVRRARDAFVEQFACHRPDYLIHWRGFLESLNP